MKGRLQRPFSRDADYRAARRPLCRLLQHPLRAGFVIRPGYPSGCAPIGASEAGFPESSADHIAGTTYRLAFRLAGKVKARSEPIGSNSIGIAGLFANVPECFFLGHKLLQTNQKYGYY